MNRSSFLRMFALLTCYAMFHDIRFIVTSFYRTPEEQKKLYEEGKSKCDGITRRSRHQDWLAIDICIVDQCGAPIWHRTEDYEKLGKFWKSLGGTWGGDWASLNDIFHFEV